MRSFLTIMVFLVTYVIENSEVDENICLSIKVVGFLGQPEGHVSRYKIIG